MRIPRALAAMAAAALLVPAIAACQPAAAPTPTAAPKPAATTVPVVSPVASAAPSPSASPAASPAASAVASPSAVAAAVPTPVAAPKPATRPAPTGNELGSASNPIKMAFVPSQDASKIIASGEAIGRMLNDATGLNFRVSVPTSYAAVVEAMGSGQVDVGWLSTFAYVLAKDKGSAEIALSTVRQGSKTYRSQIIARADAGINSLEQLQGKRFAFVDAVSASGFLYPNALLLQRGFDYKTFFAETKFAGGHPQVVIAVYNKEVDAGATFGDSREGAPPTDARTNVVSTLPDVMTAVKVVATTDPIPNDTVSMRAALPADLKTLIKEGLLYVAGTTDGARELRALYNIDGLASATDADYDPVRNAARALNLNLEETIAPPKPKV